jgi:uncharacterized membrane protein
VSLAVQPLAPPNTIASASVPDRLLLGATLALIGVLVLWEAWLAPVRPGGSWLVLKALPLCVAIPGLVRRRVYTRQALSLLLPLYVAEGIVRAWSEPGRIRMLASMETLLALIAFGSALIVLRHRRTASPAAIREG